MPTTLTHGAHHHRGVYGVQILLLAFFGMIALTPLDVGAEPGSTASDLASAPRCDALHSFAAPYRIERGDTTLGTGEVRLEPAETPQCYTLRQVAKPHFLLRWLSGPAVQEAQLCRQDDRSLRSQSYRQERSGIGSDGENFALDFDWEAGEVHGGRFGTLPLQPGQSDPLSLQLRVRQWLCAQPTDQDWTALDPLRLPVIDKRGADSYTIAVIAREFTDTPAGRFDTLRVERVDAPDRQARFWLDLDNDFQLVKGEQQKRDDPIVRLTRIPAD